eukprot:scaffold20104_cov120-Isochrysis_galbana.AAC.7
MVSRATSSSRRLSLMRRLIACSCCAIVAGGSRRVSCRGSALGDSTSRPSSLGAPSDALAMADAEEALATEDGVIGDLVVAKDDPERGTSSTDVGGLNAVSMRARRLFGVTLTFSTLNPPVVRDGATVFVERSMHSPGEDLEGDLYFSPWHGDAARSSSAFSGENLVPPRHGEPDAVI